MLYLTHLMRTTDGWYEFGISRPPSYRHCRLQSHLAGGASDITTVSAASLVGHYACCKWPRMARMSAPEWTARRASTLPHGMVMRFCACIRSPCQRPGPLLSLSLPSSAFDFFFGGFWIHTASAPSTAGTSTGGGAVIRKPGSAWLKGTPAMDHTKNGKRIHM